MGGPDLVSGAAGSTANCPWLVCVWVGGGTWQVLSQFAEGGRQRALKGLHESCWGGACFIQVKS